MAHTFGVRQLAAALQCGSLLPFGLGAVASYRGLKAVASHRTPKRTDNRSLHSSGAYLECGSLLPEERGLLRQIPFGIPCAQTRASPTSCDVSDSHPRKQKAESSRQKAVGRRQQAVGSKENQKSKGKRQRAKGKNQNKRRATGRWPQLAPAPHPIALSYALSRELTTDNWLSSFPKGWKLANSSRETEASLACHRSPIAPRVRTQRASAGKPPQSFPQDQSATIPGRHKAHTASV